MKKRNSVRVKIVIVPLVLVFLGITLLAIASLYSSYQETMEQKRLAGLAVTQHVKARVEANAVSLATVNALLEDTLFTSPSAAAGFVTYASTNGMIIWQDKKGRTLKDIESNED